MSYDTWKTTNPDDEFLHRGDGKPQKLPLLRCSQCDCRANFGLAVEHFRLTGHTFTYKGTTQDFTTFAVTQEELCQRR